MRIYRSTLRELRQSAGISQRDLAKNYGIGQSTTSKRETSGALEPALAYFCFLLESQPLPLQAQIVKNLAARVRARPSFLKLSKK